VSQSEKLLADLDDADVDTKLSLLVTGWFRGLSAALEELAIAVDDLQKRLPAAAAAPGHEAPQPGPAPTLPHEEARPAQTGREDADEERLLDEARRSRDETAELRKQTEEAREEL